MERIADSSTTVIVGHNVVNMTVIGNADSVVFCCSCRKVVGIDNGRPVDSTIIELEVNSHVQMSPRDFHEIDRVIVATHDIIGYRTGQKPTFIL